MSYMIERLKKWHETRQYCLTHNIAWDDGSLCPRKGQKKGGPLEVVWKMPENQTEE